MYLHLQRTQPRISLPPGYAVRLPARRGMGSLTGQTATIAQAAQQGADVTAAMLVALGTIGGPVGAVIAGIAALGVTLANLFSGCGQTCVEATNIANQAEPILDQNLTTYLSAPVHYASLQAAALNNFQTTWNGLVSACSNPQLGSAGQACISDRQQGGCHYKASPGGWVQQNGVWVYTPWGPEGSGSSCWNWFVGYHDPIANDPTVVPDPVSSPLSAVSSAVSSITGNASIAGIPIADLLLPAALIIAALVFL